MIDISSGAPPTRYLRRHEAARSRSVFERSGKDRHTSVGRLGDLPQFEDGQWNEWIGENDDRPPRRLSERELARLLRPFRIRPRTIRLDPTSPTARGYHRADFVEVWSAYCPDLDTPAATPKPKAKLRAVS